jgi:D-alanyl-D-alanine carboxypeptidase
LTAALAASLVAAPATVRAATYSSIVIEADSGNIVSQNNPDSLTYPASLTKMMTLYLTFEALEHKTLTLDQRLPVSAHAAGQEPTKLDLVAGTTVAVRDLILGLVTQSANDAAVVLAEGQGGGNEAVFAERMTRTARAMGMDSTTYHNASGLPNPFQRTTARDIATLARRLYLDFPREYAYFSTEEFTFNGVTYSNHNHLMSSFAGMDGIKTGFIRASGFNLAASAVRNNRRLIGIVMGGQSAHARDLKMASLLNAAFDGRPADDTQYAAATLRPKLTLRLAQIAPKAGGNTLGRLAHGAVRTLAAISPIGRAEAATPKRVATGPENWSIQLAGYRQHTAAVRAGSAALARLPAEHGKPVVVVAAKIRKAHLYHARIVNLTQSQALNACQTLRHDHRSCSVLGPSVQMAALHTTLKTAVE